MNRPSSLLWRPATTHILIGGVVVLLIALVVAYAVAAFKPTTRVHIGGGVYNVWVADTEAERIQGLSGVEKMGPGDGLLMRFDTDDKWAIWMKDMKIPIDIVWLNKAKKVVYIVKNASPDTSTAVIYTPRDESRYVLELTAGSVDRAGIHTGAVAQFDETGFEGGR